MFTYYTSVYPTCFYSISASPSAALFEIAKRLSGICRLCAVVASLVIITILYALSTAGIATSYGLDGPEIEFILGRDFPCCPDRPHGPPNFLHNGYRVFKAAEAWC
jgi:hypothetical protein